MFKIFLAGALGCSAISATAQYTEAQLDSIASSITLDEVTVKASSRIAKADRNIIIPPHQAVESSVNARDLIARLHIPRITLNPLTGEIGLSGNGNVVLTINGIIAGSAEVSAIAPQDVVRVEHVDNPGPRYPDADVVINIITRRHSSGASLAVDFMNAFRKGGEADMDNLSLSYSHGKSQWSYTGQLMRLKRSNWTRDYNEIRHEPNRTVVITETGLPSLMELANLNNYLSYSIANSDRYLFNAKVGFIYNNVPHSEEADRTTLRQVTGDTDPTMIYEHMGELTLTPSIDLYGMCRFNNGGSITANLVGTYIKTKSNQVYAEHTLNNALIEQISSHVRGKKYSLISEALYNRQLQRHSFSAGARYFQAYATNLYTADNTQQVAIRQAQTSLYGRYSLALHNFNLMGSLGATCFYSSQDETRNSRWIFTPSLAAGWTPIASLSFRYKAALQGQIPSLAQLSDVVRTIEPGYIRRGNPQLRPFRVLEHSFSVGWEASWLNIDLSIPMTHRFKPVMECVEWSDGQFVRTFYNQKSFTHIGAEATLTFRPWHDFLVLSLTPSVDYYHARGYSFNSSHTLYNLLVAAEFNWRNWQLSYNTFSGYANFMEGTRLMRERNMSMLMAGYKSDKYVVKIGVLDPFVKKYWMETREFAPLMQSVSRAYSSTPTYFVAQLSINLDFGRRNSEINLYLDNSDRDNGLLKGVK